MTAPDIPALLHALERELSSGAFDCVDWCEPTDDVPCRSCRVKMLSDAAIAALTAEVERLDKDCDDWMKIAAAAESAGTRAEIGRDALTAEVERLKDESAERRDTLARVRGTYDMRVEELTGQREALVIGNAAAEADSRATIATLTAEVERLTLSDLASREWVERFKVYVTRTDATIAALTAERDDARETLTVHSRAWSAYRRELKASISKAKERANRAEIERDEARRWWPSISGALLDAGLAVDNPSTHADEIRALTAERDCAQRKWEHAQDVHARILSWKEPNAERAAATILQCAVTLSSLGRPGTAIRLRDAVDDFKKAISMERERTDAERARAIVRTTNEEAPDA